MHIVKDSDVRKFVEAAQQAFRKEQTAIQARRDARALWWRRWRGALLIGVAATIALGLLLGGCAHRLGQVANAPYTMEQSVDEYVGDWFGDQGPSILRVINPLAGAVSITVACVSHAGTGDGWDRWGLTLQAHSDQSVFFQKLDADRMVSVCHIEAWALMAELVA